MKCKKGYKKVSGKCKASGIFKKSRKSYSPWKMWGSYVGAVIYPLIPIIIIFSQGGVLNSSSVKFLKIIAFPLAFVDLSGTVGLGGGGFIGVVGVLTIFGFLLGWGIHSLIRKVKR